MKIYYRKQREFLGISATYKHIQHSNIEHIPVRMVFVDKCRKIGNQQSDITSQTLFLTRSKCETYIALPRKTPQHAGLRYSFEISENFSNVDQFFKRTLRKVFS